MGGVWGGDGAGELLLASCRVRWPHPCALSLVRPLPPTPSPSPPHPHCRILGHAIEDQTLKVVQPKKLSAPGLPELNHSQARLVAVCGGVCVCLCVRVCGGGGTGGT